MLPGGRLVSGVDRGSACSFWRGPHPQAIGGVQPVLGPLWSSLRCLLERILTFLRPHARVLRTVWDSIIKEWPAVLGTQVGCVSPHPCALRQPTNGNNFLPAFPSSDPKVTSPSPQGTLRKSTTCSMMPSTLQSSFMSRLTSISCEGGMAQPTSMSSSLLTQLAAIDVDLYIDGATACSN